MNQYMGSATMNLPMILSAAQYAAGRRTLKITVSHEHLCVPRKECINSEPQAIRAETSGTNICKTAVLGVAVSSRAMDDTAR